MLQSRGCVGSQIRLVGCVSIGKHLTQLSVKLVACLSIGKHLTQLSVKLVACLSIGKHLTQLPNGQTSNQPDLTAYTATALQHI